jgi:hypothetical protein
MYKSGSQVKVKLHLASAQTTEIELQGTMHNGHPRLAIVSVNR